MARKLKGYQSASVKTQDLVRADAANFKGILTGPAPRAVFRMLLVKQRSGAWAVGSFQGPDPE